LIKGGTGGAAFTATEALPGFKEFNLQPWFVSSASEYESPRDALKTQTQ
jgi:GTP-binding protein LepA